MTIDEYAGFVAGTDVALLRGARRRLLDLGGPRADQRLCVSRRLAIATRAEALERPSSTSTPRVGL